jgi:hypothetical protein
LKIPKGYSESVNRRTDNSTNIYFTSIKNPHMIRDYVWHSIEWSWKSCLTVYCFHCVFLGFPCVIGYTFFTLVFIQLYCGNQDHLTKVISSCLPYTNTYRFNSLFSLNYRWIATYYLFYTCLEITVTTYNSTTVIWPFWIWFTNTKIICSIIILNRECHNFETGIGVQCDWWETD